MLADAGYLSEHNLTVDGPPRLIATGKHRDLHKTRRGSHHRHPMTGRSHNASAPGRPGGREQYKRRGATVEPVNAHLKHGSGCSDSAVGAYPRSPPNSTWRPPWSACNAYPPDRATAPGLPGPPHEPPPGTGETCKPPAPTKCGSLPDARVRPTVDRARHPPSRSSFRRCALVETAWRVPPLCVRGLTVSLGLEVAPCPDPLRPRHRSTRHDQGPRRGEKNVARSGLITAYDALTASLFDKAGIP